MASHSMFTVLKIPKQFDNDALQRRYVDKYKEFRLQSLQSDPDSFFSSFFSESKQPLEFWTGRMLAPTAQHFVGVQLNTDSSASVRAGDTQAVVNADWVGILVVLGPTVVDKGEGSSWKSLAQSQFVDKEAETNSDSSASAYHLAGFFVVPEVRENGLGGLLVHAAIDSIVQANHNARAICTVCVSHKSSVVQRLFGGMGFVKAAEEECKTEDGRHWTDIVMRRDLGQ